MTFDPVKLVTLGGQLKGGSAFQTFGYLGDVDGKDTISASGYFNGVKESLRRNDLVLIYDKDSVVLYTLAITRVPLSGDVETTLTGINTSSLTLPTTIKTANYTVTVNDYTIIIDASSNPVSITLLSAVGYPGRIYNFKCVDNTFAAKVIAYTGETIDNEIDQTLGQWDNMKIQSEGNNWVIL